MSVPQGRPFLQSAYKALQLSQCIMPVLSQRYRGARKIAGRTEPTFERFFYTPAVEEGFVRKHASDMTICVLCLFAVVVSEGINKSLNL